jgi:hypothetical protein
MNPLIQDFRISMVSPVYLLNNHGLPCKAGKNRYGLPYLRLAVISMDANATARARSQGLRTITPPCRDFSERSAFSKFFVELHNGMKFFGCPARLIAHIIGGVYGAVAFEKHFHPLRRAVVPCCNSKLPKPYGCFYVLCRLFFMEFRTKGRIDVPI